jgi:hydroxylamine reductase (hybrid-cluster protein)
VRLDLKIVLPAGSVLKRNFYSIESTSRSCYCSMVVAESACGKRSAACMGQGRTDILNIPEALDAGQCRRAFCVGGCVGGY